MARSKPKQPWKVAVTPHYQLTMRTVVTLAVALIGVPAAFLERAAGRNLLGCLPAGAIAGFALLALAIVLALLYFYFSAKWVKQAWGERARVFVRVEIGTDTLECILDWSFGLALLAFALGGTLALWFLLTVAPGGCG
jgi:hypothetical protein